MKNITVGLVVDNPQRDLEGLVLVAGRLAKRGLQVLLIPMYKQRFVARFENIDVIVLNYLRPNNLDIFLDYKRAGIKVVILDTEGIAGRDFEEFADLVSESKMTHLIDLYMFWGSGQMSAVENRGLVPVGKTVVTGCPRYDFFVDPWSRAIETNIPNTDFILFNTNFPIVNPKFSSGKGDEYKTLLRVGFPDTLARELAEQNVIAFAGMKELIKSVAISMPAQSFVLRPHPFENINGYEDLAGFSNIEVVQQGSSNAWISKSKCLVHLNCSTAVEAALMGKPILSPGWLNNTAIFRPLPDALSKSVSNTAEMIEMLAEHNLQNITSTSSSDITRELIHQSFHDIDGKSASRVTDAIVCLATESDYSITIKNRPIMKILKRVFLNLTDQPILWQIKERFKKLNKSKYFTANDVDFIVGRLQKVDPSFATLVAMNIHRYDGSKSKFCDVIAVRLSDKDNLGL